MNYFQYILIAMLLTAFPEVAAAELWQCKSDVKGRVVFTNQPLGDCQKYHPRAGSFSSVSQTYFDLLLEEHRDYFRQSPLGQLALDKEESLALKNKKPKERKDKVTTKQKKKLAKSNKLSQKTSEKLWR